MWLHALACLSVLVLALPAAAGSLLAVGGFEEGNRGARPAEFWHRAGPEYLSAYPAWEVTEERPHEGRACLTTASRREFIACGESGVGTVTGTAWLRAAKADTRVTLRLSWWNRLTRVDEKAEVVAGTEWALFQVKAAVDQGGPVELAVQGSGDVRLWLDDAAIEGAPPLDQMVETDAEGKQKPVPPVKPTPADLGPLQVYAGGGVDRKGTVPLVLDVPATSTRIPVAAGGVPWPRGELFRRERVRVLDATGREVPHQADVLARWHADRSIKVLLLSVPVSARPPLSLEYGPGVTAAAFAAPLRVDTTARQVSIRTGVVTLSLGGADTPALPTVTLGSGAARPGVVESVKVERAGPLACVVAVRGRHRSAGRFVTRYTCWRGSPLVGIAHCWINDEPGPWLPLQSLALDVRCPGVLAGPYVTQVARGAKLRLLDGGVPVDPPESEARHPGLFDGRLAVRDFAENHPLGVQQTADAFRVWLWPETVRGLLAPGGLARQWESLVDLQGRSLDRPYRTEALPILAAGPEWMCRSGVFEFLLPPDSKTFPVFERRVGSIPTLGRFARAEKERAGLLGALSYGDAPGDGGWANLESMADHELFLHWMRTLSREHFDMARLAAEHYRDVDIHHAGGFCHTHCNNHTGSEEGWSHSWVQGVRDLYFLLGDGRSLDVLQEVEERLLTKPIGWTTGRDWTRPIDNLVDIFGATGDERALACVRRHVAELGRRQDPSRAVCGAERNSWYEDRYAAGCAFTWYGCQAMAKLHHETADAGVLRVLRREVDLSLDAQTKSLRSNVILPGENLSEDVRAAVIADPFALGRGSTLFPALGYLAQVTGERRYVDLGMKILAHYMLNLRGGSDASATSYATVFLHYARQAGITAGDEAAAFRQARDVSWERWPRGMANGGFEADDFAHWDVRKIPGKNAFYDDLVKVGYALDDKAFHGGRRSLRLHSDNRDRHMAVAGRFALQPATRYRAVAWVKADPTMHPGVALSLREYDTDATTGVPLRPDGVVENGWARYSGELTTAGRAVATWTLTNGGGTGDAWFDDVALSERGKAFLLLTNNGGSREGRSPAYGALNLGLEGGYTPDAPMMGDTPEPAGPIPFARGCLTDGVSGYDHLQKPLPSYCYWQGRKSGKITIHLDRPRAVRRVRVNALIRAGVHGVQAIALKDAAGTALARIEPAGDGWNDFDDLQVTASELHLEFTALPGATYTTLSEIEVWGEK